jgi:hypothetical protein
VLLDGEGAVVEACAEDLDVWEEASHEATEGEGDQLSDQVADRHGWVSEEVELVEARDDDSHDHSENPYAEGVAGHLRVVGVGDGGSDLGVGGVLLDIAKVRAVEIRIVEVSISDFLDDMFVGVVKMSMLGLDVVLLVLEGA